MGILAGRSLRMRASSHRTSIFDLIKRGQHHAMNLQTKKGPLPRQN